MMPMMDGAATGLDYANMYDEKVTIKSLGRMPREDRKLWRQRVGVERKLIVESLLEHMEDGAWYTYATISEKSGVPIGTIENLVHRMVTGQTPMAFDRKREKVNGRGPLLNMIRATEDESIFKIAADKPHDVPPGYDASLLAACFPKYRPVIEEEETCI
jgi:hypothetical protein